mmetsp:Transcript_21903/g.54609  ORF Transcript_21903/g.54609 Transcript_21903/m.54609 type:complete len:213 (-) Transcript_21903:203-841(-)
MRRRLEVDWALSALDLRRGEHHHEATAFVRGQRSDFRRPDRASRAQWHLDETHVLPREQVDGRRVPEASQRAPLERQLLAPPEPWLLADAQVGGEHEVEQPASLHNRRVTQHPAAGGVRAEKDRLAGEGLPPATVGRREQSEPVAKAVANSIAVRGAILESCHHISCAHGLACLPASGRRQGGVGRSLVQLWGGSSRALASVGEMWRGEVRR